MKFFKLSCTTLAAVILLGQPLSTVATLSRASVSDSEVSAINLDGSRELQTNTAGWSPVGPHPTVTSEGDNVKSDFYGNSGISLSADGKLMAYQSGSITRLLKFADGNWTQIWVSRVNQWSPCLSGDGSTLFTMDFQRHVIIYSILEDNSLQEIFTFSKTDQYSHGYAWHMSHDCLSYDGSRFVLGDTRDYNVGGNKVSLYERSSDPAALADIETSYVLVDSVRETGNGGWGHKVSLSGDGKRFAVGSWNGDSSRGASIYEERDGQIQLLGSRITGSFLGVSHQFGRGVSISGDGSKVACTTYNGWTHIMTYDSDANDWVLEGMLDTAWAGEGITHNLSRDGKRFIRAKARVESIQGAEMYEFNDTNQSWSKINYFPTFQRSFGSALSCNGKIAVVVDSFFQYPDVDRQGRIFVWGDADWETSSCPPSVFGAPLPPTVNDFANYAAALAIGQCAIDLDSPPTAVMSCPFNSSEGATTKAEILVGDCATDNGNFARAAAGEASTDAQVIASVDFTSIITESDKNSGSFSKKFCARADVFANNGTSDESVGAVKYEITAQLDYDKTGRFNIASIQTAPFQASTTAATANRIGTVNARRCNTDGSVMADTSTPVTIGSTLNICVESTDNDVSIEVTSLILQSLNGKTLATPIADKTPNFVTSVTAFGSNDQVVSTLMVPSIYDDAPSGDTISASGSASITYSRRVLKATSRDLQAETAEFNVKFTLEEKETPAISMEGAESGANNARNGAIGAIAVLAGAFVNAI